MMYESIRDGGLIYAMTGMAAPTWVRVTVGIAAVLFLVVQHRGRKR